jgi:hypothetical protein
LSSIATVIFSSVIPMGSGKPPTKNPALSRARAAKATTIGAVLFCCIRRNASVAGKIIHKASSTRKGISRIDTYVMWLFRNARRFSAVSHLIGRRARNGTKNGGHADSANLTRTNPALVLEVDLSTGYSIVPKTAPFSEC